MKMYEINETLRAALEMEDEWAEQHEGDVSDFPLADELAAVEMARDEKALGVAAYIKELRAEAEAVKAAKMALGKRQGSLEAKADRIEAWLSGVLPEQKKLADATTVISWRKSTSVYVPPELTPETVAFHFPDLCETKISIKKAACKELIKLRGEAIQIGTAAGTLEIKLEEKTNIQIK